MVFWVVDVKNLATVDKLLEHAINFRLKQINVWAVWLPDQ